jgi:hypothetical protein
MDDYEKVFQILEETQPLIQAIRGVKAQFMEAGFSELMAEELVLEMFKKSGNRAD